MDPSLWDDGPQPDFLLTVNDGMLQVRQKLLEVADTGVTVVLRGEPGLGKEVLAANLHRWAPRAAGPFVRVHCDAVAPAQLALELFGANAGSAPNGGAAADGARTPLSRARGGTLYLRNVDALPRDLLERLGAELARSANESDRARLVISLESRDVDPAVGEFLEPLLAGGAGVALDLPPLRQRPEDIGLLAQHLLQLHALSHSTRIRQVRASLVELFKQHAWPGNVRELERVIRRLMVLEDEAAIRRELEEKLRGGNGHADGSEEFPQGMKLAEISRLAAQRAEARAIRRALERTRWNKKAAAAELGVSYKSLLNKVRDYRLDS